MIISEYMPLFLVLLCLSALHVQTYDVLMGYRMRKKRESITGTIKVACSRRPDLPYCRQHENPKADPRYSARAASRRHSGSFNRGITNFGLRDISFGIEQASDAQTAMRSAYDSEVISPGETLQMMVLEPMALARRLSTVASFSASQNSAPSKSLTLTPLFRATHGTKSYGEMESNDNDLLFTARETSTERPKHPFDHLQERPDLMGKLHRSTTSDLNGDYRDDRKTYEVIPARRPVPEGFLEQDGMISTVVPPAPQAPDSLLDDHTGLQTPYGADLTVEDMFLLCQQFLPIAAVHCTKNPVEKRFAERCKGYLADCAPFLLPSSDQQKAQSVLEQIANAYSSGVGVTYYHWGVNGIPFYPINEEGSISNGANAKVDYGSWGAGYSNNFGVRDYWTMNDEAGANWYEGLYGYRTGWHVPIVQSLGVEGGGGLQVHVPIKEGDFGKPLHATSGYFVGPYAGVADSTGIDWLNGRVTKQSGFASPFVGVNVNSGSSIGFPSIGSIMSQLATNAKNPQFSANSVFTQQFSAPKIYDLMQMFSN